MRLVGFAGVELVAVLGVTLQFLQSGDPRFPLLYFTVDSVVLFAAVAPLCWRGPTIPRMALLESSVAGMLLSALVFWGGIVPVNGMGAPNLTLILANIVLHSLAPIGGLRVLLQLPYNAGARGRSRLALWGAYPVLYTVVTFTLVARGVEPAYAFLSVNRVGLLAVLASSTAALVLYFVIAFAVDKLVRRNRTNATG